MKILALEFSSTQRSVAVVQPGGNALAAPVISAEAVEAGGRSPNLLSLVEDAMRAAALDRAQIECLAIGLGPGSYAGIRSAIALAQGWQLAREVKLIGISSVDCLAAQAREEGIRGRVHVVIDAQRNEFYLAGYEVDAETWREVEPLRLATLPEARTRLETEGTVIGPEAANGFPGSRVIFPRAATLGRLACGRTDFIPGEALEPIYLRPTQFVKAPPPRIVPSP